MSNTKQKKEFPTPQMKTYLREKIVRGSSLKREKIKISFQFWTIGNLETLYSFRQEYIGCIKKIANVVSNTEARYELGKVKNDFQNGWTFIELVRIDLTETKDKVA